eukprot:TRINITY_DN11340_c1_g1_i2.p1 TRINITY_DN11340_c1_g1~~TRINITY_DN11340_c1_g1_i2.p1  ORF type:complete len:484 (+),score=106.67 TRINITY_DN11340_c1_g1_i2:62-1513(+)
MVCCRAPWCALICYFVLTDCARIVRRSHGVVDDDLSDASAASPPGSSTDAQEATDNAVLSDKKSWRRSWRRAKAWLRRSVRGSSSADPPQPEEVVSEGDGSTVTPCRGRICSRRVRGSSAANALREPKRSARVKILKSDGSDFKPDAELSDGVKAELARDLAKLRVEQCSAEHPVQVFTDVDDTIKSAGGQGVAGCDTKYGKNVVYPGMAQFYLELARGFAEGGDAERQEVLRPALLTARPDVAMVTEKGLEARTFADIGEANARFNIKAYDYQTGGIGASAPRPYGLNLEKGGVYLKKAVYKLAGRESELQGGSKNGRLRDGVSHESFGDTKVRHVQSIVEREMGKQSYCIIFVGDNGQGDCNPAAYKMRLLKKPGERELALKASFIHRVQCKEKARPCLPLEAGAGAPIFIFDTYLDAAHIARKQKYISGAGYARVWHEVNRFFERNCVQDVDLEIRSAQGPQVLTDKACAELKQKLGELI